MTQSLHNDTWLASDKTMKSREKWSTHCPPSYTHKWCLIVPYLSNPHLEGRLAADWPPSNLRRSIWHPEKNKRDSNHTKARNENSGYIKPFFWWRRHICDTRPEWYFLKWQSRDARGYKSHILLGFGFEYIGDCAKLQVCYCASRPIFHPTFDAMKAIGLT